MTERDKKIVFKKGEVVSNKILVDKLGNKKQKDSLKANKRLCTNTKKSLLKKLSIYTTYEEIKINNKTFYKITKVKEIKKIGSKPKKVPGGEVKFLLEQLLLNIFKEQKNTVYYSNSKLLKELNLLSDGYFYFINKESLLSETLQVDVRAVTYFKKCLSYVSNTFFKRTMLELKEKKIIKATINTISIDSKGKHKVVNKKESIDLEEATNVVLKRLNATSKASLFFSGRYSDYSLEICKEMQNKGYDYKKFYEGYKVIRVNCDSYKIYSDDVEFMVKNLKKELVNRIFKVAISIKNNFIKKNNLAFGEKIELSYIESKEFINDIRVLIEYFIGVECF